MSERTEKLKKNILALDKAGIRRSLREAFIEESLRENRGESRDIRRAKSFKHLLDKAELVILNGELIIGSVLGLYPLKEFQPQYEEVYKEAKEHLFKMKTKDKSGLRKHRWAMMERDYYGGTIPYRDLQSIAQSLATEYGKELRLAHTQIFDELERHFSENAPRNYPKEMRELPWIRANHIPLDYEKVLKRGYKGILEQAQGRLKEVEGEKKEFIEAVVISIKAAIAFIRRYGNKANLEKRNELRKIAGICQWVAENPARDFREALQLFWLTHTILNIAGGSSGSALAAGRFDQYIYPFYKKDLDEGRITREKAAELLECIWIKFNEPRVGTVQNLTIGGVGPDGEDRTNEISYLCLEVAARVKMPYPNLTVRLHKGTPKEFYHKVAETIKLGMGIPSLFNDEVLIPALERAGMSSEDAWDYCVMGCMEVMIPKKQVFLGGPGVDFARCLELVFKNGRRNGEKVGLETGDPCQFSAFEDFLNAYKRQVSYIVKRGVQEIEETRQRELYERGSDPFGSALLEDCIERGKDMYRGGTICPTLYSSWGIGLATTADSLAALKKLVYEKKKVAMDELIGTLDNNFENQEALHQMLFTWVPKYGNDDDFVDDITKEIGEHYCREVLSYRGLYGEIYAPILGSYVGHVALGEANGATPDGRRKGEPLSQGASPAQGRDRNGPTAVLNSVTKLDWSLVPGGAAVTTQLNPQLLKGKKGTEMLVAFLRSYIEKKGEQIQFNMVSKEMLKKAKACPEKHGNIIVRVTGFCEYFVKLDAKLQDEIISRMG